MTEYTMTEEATYDNETGEIQEPKLSREAMKGVRLPNLWQKRDNTHTGLMAGDEFAYAYLCVQEELKPIIATDKENPFIKKDKKDSTQGDYTSLGALLRVVRPVLNRWFITLEQYTGDVFGLTDTAQNKHLFLPVFTRLEHIPSMQSKVYKMPMPIVKFDCQAVGSAFSYGKRYSLLGALGIASGADDDDGNSASVVKGIDNKLGEFAQGLSEQIKGFKTLQELRRWAQQNASGFDILEESDRQKLRTVYEDRLAEFASQDPAANGRKAK
jgi:hypothetical protein